MRRTLFAAAAAALALVATSSTAVAGTFIPAPAPPKEPAPNPGPSPLKDAVTTYMKQYGTTHEHALAVLLAQSRGAHLEEELRDELGDGFGGLAFDQDKARFDVWLAPSGSAKDAGRVLDRHGLGNARIAATKWSAVAREREVERLAASRRADLAEGDVTIASTPEDGVAVKRSDQPKLEAQACDSIRCDPPLIAGVQYGPSGCNTAFSTTAGGGMYQLTAGHCTYVPNWPSQGRINTMCGPTVGCSTMGADIGGYAGAGGDAGLMSTGGMWANYPAVRVYGWSSLTYAVPSVSNPWVGRYLCHTGWASKTSCGTVTTLTASGAFGGTAMTRVVGACNQPGDSGGPWFDPSTMSAVGIHSAGDGNMQPPCSSATTAFEPVTRAASVLGVSVKTI